MIVIRPDQLEALNQARERKLRRRVLERFTERSFDLTPEEHQAIVDGAFLMAKMYHFYGEEAVCYLARWATVPVDVWQPDPWGPVIQRTLANEERDGDERIETLRRDLIPRLARQHPEALEALRRADLFDEDALEALLERGSGSEPAPTTAEEVAT